MAEPQPNPKENNDDVVTVTLVYNIKTNQFGMSTKAPTMILLGMLGMAHARISQRLVLDHIEAAAQKALAEKGKLEVQPKIVLPGGGTA